MMIRPISFLLITLAMILSVSTRVHAGKPVMATVDMQKLFKEYHRTVDAQKRFNTEYARIQKGVNERREIMQRTQRMLRTVTAAVKSGELDVEEKAKKESEGKLLAQELKMMEAEVKRYSVEERQRVARLKAASMQGIMHEIRQKVIDHAKEQSYDFVFDKSGKNTNQVSFFIYLKDAKDITAVMLKELNKFAPDANDN